MIRVRFGKTRAWVLNHAYELRAAFRTISRLPHPDRIVGIRKDKA